MSVTTIEHKLRRLFPPNFLSRSFLLSFIRLLNTFITWKSQWGLWLMCDSEIWAEWIDICTQDIYLMYLKICNCTKQKKKYEWHSDLKLLLKSNRLIYLSFKCKNCGLNTKRRKSKEQEAAETRHVKKRRFTIFIFWYLITHNTVFSNLLKREFQTYTAKSNTYYTILVVGEIIMEGNIEKMYSHI